MTPSSTPLVRVLTPVEAMEILRAEHTSDSGAIAAKLSQDQLISEYIRQTVYDLATEVTTDKSSAYVTTITNNVRRQLAPVKPRLQARRNRRPSAREQEAEADVDPDPIRRVMESLDDLRDIVNLGDGYWAPTPLRLVRLDEDTALVVGGVPTSVVRKEMPTSVSLRWIARTVHVPALPESLRADLSKWQSLGAWLGEPPDDLSKWTAECFANAKTRLKISASELTEFELYLPGRHRQRPQAFRWAAADTVTRLPDGLMFCRAFEGHGFGMRRHWIGTVARSRSGLHAESECAVPSTSARRLQYGIDLREKAQTSIDVDAREGFVEITMTNPLPPEERRLLVAFGEESSSRLGKFPLRYRLDDRSYNAIRPLLDRLGIRLTSI